MPHPLWSSPRRRALLVLALAAVLAVGLLLAAGLRSPAPAAGHGGPAASVAPAKAPVVVVVFDEFPLTSLLDGRNGIDAERYPNFAAFARDSTWFRNATSVHDRTTKAVPAILTGYVPRRRQLPFAAHHPRTLFTLLGRRGYRLNVSEEATLLCPGRCGRRGRRARGRASVRALERAIVRRVHGGRVTRWRRWLRRIRGGRPSLNFKHVFFPHVPFQHLPSGRRYLRSWRELVRGVNDRTLRDDWLVKQLYQRHLLQLGFTDRLIGGLVRRLKQQGLYDQSLIVFVADHGAAFRRHLNRRRVYGADLEDLASIPLLVKAPNQRSGRISDVYARTTDVLPTIADLLDVRLRWRIHGRSAFSAAVRRRRTVVQYRGPNSTIGTARDRRVAMRARRFEARQARALRRKLRLFGSGADAWRLFRIGPHRGLLGRPVDGLRVLPRRGLRARFSRPRTLLSVRRGSGFVPVQIAGRLAGRGSRRKRALAIAVNGVVGAVGESFRIRGHGPGRFSLLVPEHLLREGHNRVELLAVRRAGGSLRLRFLGRVG